MSAEAAARSARFDARIRALEACVEAGRRLALVARIDARRYRRMLGLPPSAGANTQWSAAPRDLAGWRALLAEAEAAGEWVLAHITGTCDLIDGVHHVAEVGANWVGSVDAAGDGWSVASRHVRAVLRIPAPGSP